MELRGRRALLWRVVPGTFLLVGGIVIASRLGVIWPSVVPALFAGAAVVVGVLLLLAPWWLQSAIDLARERRDRVRIEERAALAAHLHDSVLQTLTLIERVADDAGQVRRLARSQERELRQWLYDPRSPNGANGSTFGDALRALQSDVESDYGVRVELVVVDDAPMDDAVAAVVAAAREAAVNAAKWSGADQLSLYAEVDASAMRVYVRDEGRGFDVTTVPEDRHGIRSSIEARVEAVGGRARVESQPGRGTEVTIELERATQRA